MKLFVAILFAFVAAASADNVEIDWSKVKPITQMPGFWDGRIPVMEKYYNPLNRQGRIVGGEIAAVGQFPYQCALLSAMEGGSGLCGGSILNANTILTAAHCADDSTLTTVTVIMGASDRTNPGANSQTRVSPASTHVHLHPQYNRLTIVNDIAIVKLTTPVAFTAFIQPIALPSGAQLTDLFAGVPATVSGFGRFDDDLPQASNVVRFVNLNTITNLACRIRFPTLIQDENICTSGDDGRSPCHGDSGGPLAVIRDGRSVQIGVVSFGSPAGCSTSWPAAYARVTSFMSFINGHL